MQPSGGGQLRGPQQFRQPLDLRLGLRHQEDFVPLADLVQLRSHAVDFPAEPFDRLDLQMAAGTQAAACQTGGGGDGKPRRLCHDVGKAVQILRPFEPRQVSLGFLFRPFQLVEQKDARRRQIVAEMAAVVRRRRSHGDLDFVQ